MSMETYGQLMKMALLMDLGIFAEVDFSQGPEYFSRLRPPNPQGSISTRSDSSRSSANQVGPHPTCVNGLSATETKDLCG
jgi:hypothetical protein